MNVLSVVITFWFFFTVNNNIVYFLTNCLFLISNNDTQTCIVYLRFLKANIKFKIDYFMTKETVLCLGIDYFMTKHTDSMSGAFMCNGQITTRTHDSMINTHE
jgi:hypothetical protein